MEAIQVDKESFESMSTPDEILDNALGDRRRKKLKKRRTKLAGKKNLSAREKKQFSRAKRGIAKIGKRQQRRKTIKKKVTSALKKSGFAVLLPMRGVMRKALERKGISTKSMPIETLAKEFYNQIVVKNSDSYEQIVYDPDTDSIDPITITAIVSAIIGFVKRLKRARDEGKELSPAQNQIVDGMETVQDKLIFEAKKETSEELGKTLFLDGNIWLIAAGVLVLIILIKS